MAQKTYSWEEIRKHNKDTDCWVVLYGKVIDVTSFLSRHPGGLPTLCDMGGYDATNQFEAVGHSDKAAAIWQKLQIGIVEPGAIEPKPKPKAVRREAKVEAWTEDSYTMGQLVAFAVCVLLALVVGAYFLLP